MVYASTQLNGQLPSELLARVEESLAVETDDGRLRVVYPDISVVEQEAFIGGLQSEPAEAPTQRRLEIVDSSSGNRIVTVIELLRKPSGQPSIRLHTRFAFDGLTALGSLLGSGFSCRTNCQTLQFHFVDRTATLYWSFSPSLMLVIGTVGIMPSTTDEP